jgi:isopropylmalate/homocitrate/citramalate synthase
MSSPQLDRSKIWTGDLNARALEPQPRITVGLHDRTLRDGERAVGVVLSPEDKLRIAQALDEAGVDRIAVGDVRGRENSNEVGLILEAGLRAEVWGFSRSDRADLEALVELGVGSSVIDVPISDGRLAALGVSRQMMLERIRSAVSFAAGQGMRVAFAGADSSRAAIEFVRQAYETAVEGGASEIVVADTLGIATPEAAAFLVGEVSDRLGGEVPVHWHGHDDFGLATASSVAAVQAGATWVQGTVNGMGERGGNASLVEVALVLEVLYGIPTRLRLERARSLAGLVAELTGTTLAPWTSITGESVFVRESGPVDEPFAPELVGAQPELVLGTKSDLESIRSKLEELQLEVPEDLRPQLLDAVTRLARKKGSLLSDADFRRLVTRSRPRV